MRDELYINFDVLANAKLNLAESKVFNCLMYMVTSDNTIEVTQDEISVKIKRTRATVNKAMTGMVDLGIIEKVDKGSWKISEDVLSIEKQGFDEDGTVKPSIQKSYGE